LTNGSGVDGMARSMSKLRSFRSPTGTEPRQASANIQQTCSPKGQKVARDGNTAGEGGRRTGDITANSQTLVTTRDGIERQRLSPGGNRRSARAGDEIRTHDIHVGNVTADAVQVKTDQPVAKPTPHTFSKYSANSTAREPVDRRLAVVIETWLDLPEAVRRGIAAMVEATRKAES